jgi:hypothetical protein
MRRGVQKCTHLAAWGSRSLKACVDLTRPNLMPCREMEVCLVRESSACVPCRTKGMLTAVMTSDESTSSSRDLMLPKLMDAKEPHFTMKISTSLVGNSYCSLLRPRSPNGPQVLQTFLVVLSLAITVLRCWIRLRLEHRKLNLPDYFAWGGWFFLLGWFICSTFALHIQLDHPLLPENDYKSDSVPYLVACYTTIHVDLVHS